MYHFTEGCNDVRTECHDQNLVSDPYYKDQCENLLKECAQKGTLRVERTSSITALTIGNDRLVAYRL